MSATRRQSWPCSDQDGRPDGQLVKLENLEISQKKTADVKDLKQSYGFLEEQVIEVQSDIAEKVSCKELTKLEKKIDDLENCSKRNNIVIWVCERTQRRNTTL